MSNCSFLKYSEEDFIVVSKLLDKIKEESFLKDHPSLDKDDSEEICIEPCKFCGVIPNHIKSIGESIDRYYMYCDNCGCKGPIGKSPSEALERWNLLHRTKKP